VCDPWLILRLVLALALLSPGMVIGDDSGPAYLVYAGPYSASPSSAFGHLFLVLADDAEQPLPAWTVVSFSAETHGAGAMRYLCVGISGGFLGRYQQLAFHEKTRDYQALDDRDLLLLELVLTPAERRALGDAIAATKGCWFPYTFFRLNCAHYLQRLLADVFPDIPLPGGAVSPVDVMEIVLESTHAGRCFRRPAASSRLESEFDGLDPEIRRQVSQRTWTDVAADLKWLRGLTPSERRVVHDYLAWRLLRHKEQVAEGVLEGMQYLRTLAAADTLSAGGGQSNRHLGEYVEMPVFHGYTTLAGSFSLNQEGRPSTLVRGRMALHRWIDSWRHHRPANTMEFMALSLQYCHDPGRLILDDIVLFSQRSLSPRSLLKRRRSWLLEVLGRRGGLWGNDQLHAELRGGIGTTYRLGSAAYVHGLITGAFVSDGIRRATISPGLEAGILVLGGNRWRFGGRGRYDLDPIHGRRPYAAASTFLRHDLGLSVGLEAAAEFRGGSYHYSMGVSKYLD